MVPGSFFGSEIFNDFRRTLDGWASSDPGQLKYFGGKSLITQSHGRSIMSYFRFCYSRRGIYFLDEPETALSPQSQLDLIDILRENGRAGHAQFIIATHSPILLAYEDAKIYSFDYCGYKGSTLDSIANMDRVKSRLDPMSQIFVR
jgi:predicted ATPase